jgi:hypothetical protein
VIGLGGGQLHHNDMHSRSVLIQRKDRVPNRNVRTIRRLCAAGLAGSTVFGGRRLSNNTDRLHQPVGRPLSPSEPNGAGRPLYRPHDNLAMLYSGPAKLMRMSMRNMWKSNRQ